LLLEVTVVGVPTVRDGDGLALSSRNSYLSPDERARARTIPRALRRAWSLYVGGERRAGVLCGLVTDEITPAMTHIDYVSLADPTTLRVLPDEAELNGPALLALAAYVGTTRLIDNMVLGEDVPPEVPSTG
jgi:pantoate--beta-alanine ligase